jgi:hypothetical protein
MANEIIDSGSGIIRAEIKSVATFKRPARRKPLRVLIIQDTHNLINQ